MNGLNLSLMNFGLMPIPPAPLSGDEVIIDCARSKLHVVEVKPKRRKICHRGYVTRIIGTKPCKHCGKDMINPTAPQKFHPECVIPARKIYDAAKWKAKQLRRNQVSQ